MLLPIGGSPSRLMVIAYDIPSPKRARAVRRLLANLLEALDDGGPDDAQSEDFAAVA